MVMTAYQRGLRHKGMFAVIFDGLELGLVKTFKLPDLEWEEQKFGPGGSYWDHKEAGRLLVSDFELEKGVKSDETDDWVWRNFIRIMGLPPVSYQNRQLMLCELGADMTTYRRQWVMQNAWFKKIPGLEFDGMSSDVVLEKVIGACDYVDFKNL